MKGLVFLRDTLVLIALLSVFLALPAWAEEGSIAFPGERYSGLMERPALPEKPFVIIKWVYVDMSSCAAVGGCRSYWKLQAHAYPTKEEALLALNVYAGISDGEFGLWDMETAKRLEVMLRIKERVEPEIIKERRWKERVWEVK